MSKAYKKFKTTKKKDALIPHFALFTNSKKTTNRFTKEEYENLKKKYLVIQENAEKLGLSPPKFGLFKCLIEEQNDLLFKFIEEYYHFLDDNMDNFQVGELSLDDDIWFSGIKANDFNLTSDEQKRLINHIYVLEEIGKEIQKEIEEIDDEIMKLQIYCQKIFGALSGKCFMEIKPEQMSIEKFEELVEMKLSQDSEAEEIKKYNNKIKLIKAKYEEKIEGVKLFLNNKLNEEKLLLKNIIEENKLLQSEKEKLEEKIKNKKNEFNKNINNLNESFENAQNNYIEQNKLIKNEIEKKMQEKIDNQIILYEIADFNRERIKKNYNSKKKITTFLIIKNGSNNIAENSFGSVRFQGKNYTYDYIFDSSLAYQEKVNGLLFMYDSLILGHNEICFFNGYSGVGKTSLLLQFNKINGLIIEGIYYLFNNIDNSYNEVSIEIISYCLNNNNESKEDNIGNKIFNKKIDNDILNDMQGLIDEMNRAVAVHCKFRKTPNNEKSCRSFIQYNVKLRNKKFNRCCLLSMIDAPGREKIITKEQILEILNQDKNKKYVYNKDDKKVIETYKTVRKETEFINNFNNYILELIKKYSKAKTQKEKKVVESCLNSYAARSNFIDDNSHTINTEHINWVVLIDSGYDNNNEKKKYETITMLNNTCNETLNGL